MNILEKAISLIKIIFVPQIKEPTFSIRQFHKQDLEQIYHLQESVSEDPRH